MSEDDENIPQAPPPPQAPPQTPPAPPPAKASTEAAPPKDPFAPGRFSEDPDRGRNK
jgi:hypothetical protein